MKQVISATSWNSTQFYYNWSKQAFEQSDMVDIYINDHFECEQANMESAMEIASKDGLKNVKLETIDN